MRGRLWEKASMRQSTRLAIFGGLVLVAGLLSYLPGLSGPLLFDDKPALSGNGLVHITGSSFDEWRTAGLSSGSGPLRRPIAMLTFAANYALAGNFSPLGLKAVNLGIHLAIAVILFFFCHAVLQALAIGPDANTRRLLALTAAAFWLLHPLNVSTVLYAVQRMAQLATLFVLAGLLVFMRYRRRWAELGAPPGEILAAGLWLLLLAVMATLSKENGALLPWLIIVLEVCIFRGVWAGRPDKFLRLAGWMLLLLPLLLITLIFVISPEPIIAGYASREFTLEERVLTQTRLLWRYLSWICLPNIYDMGFQHDDIPLSTGMFSPVTTVLALGAWLLLLLVSFGLRQRYPLLLLAVLFFLVGHSMESSVLPLEMVYEHRNYLPGMLVCLAVAALFVIPASRNKNLSAWYPVLGALVILCLLLSIRVHTWSDELTLSRTNLARHPDSSRSNYFYANALLRHHRRGEQFGLNEREKAEYLLLSRHYFERMYQTNERDVAALVMLFYLDGYHFTELQEQVDWLAQLEELLDTRTLQPSDWNALALLFDIFASAADVGSDERVMALLDKLATRYPRNVNVLRYRYQYLAAMDAEPAELLLVLEQAQQLAPRASWVYLALLREYGQNQDVASMYEYARLWMLYDQPRYDLHRVKALFIEAERPAEIARD
jgi:protein O-mannosyl-transferase